jgi:hypothetical protein
MIKLILLISILDFIKIFILIKFIYNLLHHGLRKVLLLLFAFFCFFILIIFNFFNNIYKNFINKINY